MKIYHYNLDTKEYMGEEDAHRDPLESLVQGRDVYLLPANATFEAPTLVYKHGYAVVWNGAKWGHMEDHRGQEVWNKSNGEKLTVTWLGAIGVEYVQALEEVDPPKKSVGDTVRRRLFSWGLGRKS